MFLSPDFALHPCHFDAFEKTRAGGASTVITESCYVADKAEFAFTQFKKLGAIPKPV